MIFIIGGRSQGKKAFAEQFLEPDVRAVWTDGARADWEGFMKGNLCCHFHGFIRRILSGELGAPGVADIDRGGELEAKMRIGEALVRALMEENPQRILVTDEIGYGIVPVDGFERRYREETGRICCMAAKEAEQVWRVCCGMGQRIK